MNRLIALGVVAIIAIYLVFSSTYVVNVREQAIVMRFGEITDVKSEPGLYFKLPTSLVDTVQIVEDRLLRYDIANMDLQVNDGATYVVDAFLTYRISDPKTFRERALGSLAQAERRIATSFDAALRQVYGKRDFNDALSVKRQEMMLEARDLIRPGLAELGIDVTDVRIVRTDLDDKVSQTTFDRMSAERLAQAAAIRAGGQQAAQSLKAIADRQAVEIVAGANRDSEILRGEGDALRIGIFAQAYGQDEEFFEFYRTMQSYRTALGSTGTTMVLAPDSEFFKYFGENSINGQTPKPAEPGGIAPLPSSQLSEPVADDPAPIAPVVDVPVTLDQATPAITPVVPVVESPAPAETSVAPSAEASSEPVPAQ